MAQANGAESPKAVEEHPQSYEEVAVGAPPRRDLSSVVMSHADYLRMSRLIHASCGIKLPPAKKTMLEGRLRKRLNALGMDSFVTYCDYIFSTEGAQAEHIHMFNAVTTNKTDFFREPDHFEVLSSRILPELFDLYGMGSKKILNVWSAACSTGEEPYTLAMVLNEFAERHRPFRFSILATDISTKVLRQAASGIYDCERVEPVPKPFRKKYLMRSKDKGRGLVRIVPELRATVRFERLNLMQENYGIDLPMGVIFCRNVIIYFDRPTQERLLQRLTAHLIPGGYLFMGHSESLHRMDLPLVPIATTIYRKV